MLVVNVLNGLHPYSSYGMFDLYQGIHLIGAPTTDVLIKTLEEKGWYLASLARDPWYNRLKGGNIKPDDIEYRSARRNNHLYVNWVDADESRFFRPEELEIILDFMDEAMHAKTPILIHCNNNTSRSPSVVMLYLASIGILPRKYEEAVATFIHKYPYFKPNTGIREFIKRVWQDYAPV